MINFDIPREIETYIHRIGRSGRFGRKGVAINFVTNKEFSHMQHIEQHYHTMIEPLPENIKDSKKANKKSKNSLIKKYLS